ncbi:hypothetical protein LJR030_001859 [Rhizobium sp. LjRoot30]|uniref:hypothetical protein n=1 Tax=Rhizobium sp. LjRoot30 TaxID=3342320 RepID=UPI003ED08D46
MTDLKEWYRSKAVWGALVAIFASLTQFLGIELGAEDQQALADTLVTLAGAVGGLLALYGRLSARNVIGKR